MKTAARPHREAEGGGQDASDAVIAAKPTADYDAKWGQGFIKPDVFIGLVFDSLP